MDMAAALDDKGFSLNMLDSDFRKHEKTFRFLNNEMAQVVNSPGRQRPIYPI